MSQHLLRDQLNGDPAQWRHTKKLDTVSSRGGVSFPDEDEAISHFAMRLPHSAVLRSRLHVKKVKSKVFLDLLRGDTQSAILILRQPLLLVVDTDVLIQTTDRFFHFF